MGMESFEEISNKHNIHNYGFLIDNLIFDDEFSNVVQVTAGKYLFNVIVENEIIANEILTIMNNEKYPGEISFIPLNKIKPNYSTFVYNENMQDDCICLNNHILIKNTILNSEKLFDLVFGNTILCKNLEIAVSYSKNYKINGITLDGDKATSRGTMMGGYFNKSFSKISNYYQFVNSKKLLKIEQDKLNEIKKSIDCNSLFVQSNFISIGK